MISSTAEVHQKAKPWPGYFLVRKTGEVVPLIAVDELPPGFDLVGVPRSLDLTVAVGMHNLGLQGSSGAYYQISQAVKSKTQSNETVGKADKSTNTPTPSTTPPKAPQGLANFTYNTNAKAPTTTAVTRPAVPPNTAPTQLPPTNLCRHWCATGFCKWGERCRWCHIMPTSQHGLKEVGLSDWPEWFRKQNPGYFVSHVRSGRDHRKKHEHGCDRGVGQGHAHGGRGERVRGAGRMTVRERESGRVVRSEELGEKTVAKLRAMAKEREEKEKQGEKVVAAGGVGSAIIERGTKKDTRKWEDDSENESEEDVEAQIEEPAQKFVVTSGKLVDV